MILPEPFIKQNPGLFQAGVFLYVLSDLLHSFNDGFKSLRVVHSQVGQHLAADLYILVMEFTHKNRIGHPMFPGGGIDPLDPQSPEITFFNPSVTVGIKHTLFMCVFRDRPDILASTKLTFGLFHDLFSARL
jgi:hypothetical protein